LVVVLLLIGLMSSLVLNGLLFTVVGIISADGETRVQEKYVSHNRHGAQKVAIFSIEGTILSGEGFFKNQIDHARKDIEDGNLKAIVLRVNSPGGTISGSDYMLHHLRKLVEDTHIPVVVSMGPVAASGGYYVSMCVGDEPNTIFAEPSTWTGSIGVVIPHYNVADLIQKWGIESDPVASDPLKTMGSIARKMTSQEREIFQQLVNDGFTQFKDVIKEGRPKFKKDPSALDKLATGQVYTSQQALTNGLIDKIGFVEDAVDRAIELAKLDKENVQVVKYKAESKLSDMIFGQSRSQPAFDLAALLDATVPQAYYLCTWLPVLAGTAK
jgi:protease-4